MRDKGCFQGWRKGAVVGNSTEESKRKVSKEEGESLGKEVGLFMEISEEDSIDA